MKILQVSPYALGRHGGVQTHVRDLCNWLEAKGHSTRIVCPPEAIGQNVLPLGKVRNISMHGTSFELSWANRRALNEAAAEILDWGADVVHLHTPWTPAMAWQIWRRLRLPTVATFHATLPETRGFDPMTAFLRRAGRYFHRHVHRIVVPSEAPFGQWQRLGVDPLPDILPPAIDLSAWRDAEKRRSPGNGPDIVYMGRFEERKGITVLLNAWPRIAKALPDAKLTLAGSGTIEADLREMANAVGKGRIRFLPPPDQTDAYSLISQADFFVAPALGGESFGLVLAEAMSAGTLPIAADNAGFASVLTGTGKDLLVPKGDAQALAEKVIALTMDANHRNALQDWAMQHARSFDVDQVGPKLLAIYQDALSARSAGSHNA